MNNLTEIYYYNLSLNNYEIFIIAVDLLKMIMFDDMAMRHVQNQIKLSFFDSNLTNFTLFIFFIILILTLKY